MPPFRYFREAAASGRGEMRVLVIAGEPIYANVRLRLTANRTYGLISAESAFRLTPIFGLICNASSKAAIAASLLRKNSCAKP